MLTQPEVQSKNPNRLYNRLPSYYDAERLLRKPSFRSLCIHPKHIVINKLGSILSKGWLPCAKLAGLAYLLTTG